MIDKFLQPLEITCKSADCQSGLHCFSQTKKMKIQNKSGQCRYCGVSLIDWDRVHKRSLLDANYTFQALRHELWRHYYWHIDIDSKAAIYARKKGKISLKLAATKRIISSVGPAQPFHDGYQTPKTGNPLYYAQHATASCCRKCIEEWHGIPSGQQLTEEQIIYFVDLIMLYLQDRLSFLSEQGEYHRR